MRTYHQMVHEEYQQDRWYRLKVKGSRHQSNQTLDPVQNLISQEGKKWNRGEPQDKRAKNLNVLMKMMKYQSQISPKGQDVGLCTL